MRGYFLVAIIIGHVGFYPNGFDWMTMRGNLYVSAAEGFFLISGIVLGIVRGRKLLDKPFRLVANLLLKRSLQLYITSIVLALLFTLIGWWFFMDNPGLKHGIMPPGTSLLDVLWRTLTFGYIYGWADYLRLYCIFLLFSPLAMWLLRKGLWYVLLAGNIAVWLLFPGATDLPSQIQEYWQPLAWQLIFFGGLTLGFYWQTLTDWWSSLGARRKQVLTWSVLGIAFITLVANIIVVYGGKGVLPIISSDLALQLEEYGTMIHREFFDKEAMPTARVIMFAFWFAASFWLFHRFEKIIVRWFGWLLLPFGQNSLYVYTLHAVVVLFIHLYFANTSIIANFAITAGVILAIRLAIHYRLLMKIIPR